jgi:hypothetical protein
MAEHKKSFILYSDLIHTIEKLNDEQAGKLFRHILQYVNDEEPQTEDFITNLAFEPIRLQLKRDLEKWGDIRIKRSEAGKRSAQAKKDKQNATKSTLVESVEQASTKSTVNDNVNVNDTVNVIKKKKAFDFKKALINEGFEEPLVEDWLQVRRKKRATNSESAFKLFFNECLKSGIEKNAILKTCIQNDWKTFKTDWINKTTNQNEKPNSKTPNRNAAIDVFFGIPGE